MKKRVTLTESQLHEMITECVRSVLTEGFDTVDSIVKEMMLHAWNTYDVYVKIVAVIKAIGKKDRDTLSVERLAKSSIMGEITRMVAKAMGVEGSGLPKEALQKFRIELAEEMIDRIDDFNNKRT